MFNVHLRVNDAATNRPTPVRLRITDAQGRFYPPLGRLAEFSTGRNEDVGGHLLMGQEPWCYIDGSCEVPLPAGVPLTIEATKGPEYAPLRETLTLGPGQMAIRWPIKHWIDLRKEGWHSGDARCHFLPPHAALLEGMAEDLSVMQLLATETDVLSLESKNYLSIPNMVAFSGQQPALEKEGYQVAVNSLNTHLVLGSLALLHCHRAVFPLSFGGVDQTDDWSLADWCDQCHRKKGLVVWADPFQFENGIAPEALADLIVGRVDAVECTPGSIRSRDWYQAWSAGIPFPLVGASGKDSNRVALGAIRTYVRLPENAPVDLTAWTEAVRSGRTFVTSGPLLEFSVDEQLPGTIVDRDAGSPPLRLRAASRSNTAYERLEIVANGEVIAHSTADRSNHRAALEFEYPLSGPCWLAARSLSDSSSDGFAHTSPIFVRVTGQMPANVETARKYRELLAATVDWVKTVGRFEIPKRKEALLALLEQARELLLARLTS
jgi:hypothetical protein